MLVCHKFYQNVIFGYFHNNFTSLVTKYSSNGDLVHLVITHYENSTAQENEIMDEFPRGEL